MNPKIKNYFFGFVLLPLAIFALVSKAKDAISFNETAPLFVIADFKTCLFYLNRNSIFLPTNQKPKKCNDVKENFTPSIKDSKILYQGNFVIGIQGQDRKTGRWYQVDTTDERYIRVVKYEE
jgi:hypothetical protein